MQNAHFVSCKEFQMLAIRQAFFAVDEIAIHDIAKNKKQNTTWTHARPEDHNANWKRLNVVELLIQLTLLCEFNFIFKCPFR